MTLIDATKLHLIRTEPRSHPAGIAIIRKRAHGAQLRHPIISVIWGAGRIPTR
jgi:hypothetical protein